VRKRLPEEQVEALLTTLTQEAAALAGGGGLVSGVFEPRPIVLEEEKQLPDDNIETEGKYIIAVVGQSKRKCLHLSGGCWRARALRFQSFELVASEVEPVPEHMYQTVCRNCWSEGLPRTTTCEESSSSSSSTEGA
jgi:hypothetical protein